MKIDIKDRIIQASIELFHKYGIKSVTMDDIAKHLGMSKKTLYQHFKDKDDLVTTKTLHDLETRIKQVDEIFKNSADAVEELMESMKYIAEIFKDMNPRVFYDMQKYHAEAWQKFREFKDKVIVGMIERNLNRGVQEGLFRPDINIPILGRLRVEEIEMAMKEEVFPSSAFSITDVQVQLTDHFLHGITTLKGHKLINRYRHLIEEE